MSRVVRWLLAGALLSGFHFSATAAPVTQVKVLSFNIWVQGGSSLSNCIEVIRTTGADIVGLQECNATTAQTIATALGFYVLPATDNSIVSRYPIFNGQLFTKGSSITVEPSPGQRFHLFDCHLTPNPYGPYDLKNGQTQTFIINQENSTRMPGLSQLMTAMQPYLAGPDVCFLVGDFNAPSHLDYTNFPWPTSVVPAEAGLGDSYREMHPGNRKYPGAFAFNEPGITWTPKTNVEPNGVFDRIDFVHYSLGDGATPTSSIDLDERNSINPWPSDHRAVLTTFTLTPPVLGNTAANPFPANNSTNQFATAVLFWTPASNKLSQAVYFGTNSPGIFRTNTTNSFFVAGALIPGATYYWRVDTTNVSGVTTGAVWSFTATPTPPIQTQTYEWTFALSNLTAALGSGVLAYADATVTSNLTAFGTTDGTTVPHIGGQPAKYMRVPVMPGLTNGYHVTFTGSGPNGGGVYLNQYTIIQDVLVPAPLNWVAFFNTNPGNANDADFYVAPDGSIGIDSGGYSATGLIAVNTWYRIAAVCDLTVGTITYFINGAPVKQKTAQTLDGRFSLYSNVDVGTDLLLFNEGNAAGNYTHQLYLNAWALVDRAMSAGEISALGGPKAAGIFPGPVLKTSFNRTGNTLNLAWTGGKGPFRVQRTGALSSPTWLDVSGPNYNRNYGELISTGPNYFRIVGN